MEANEGSSQARNCYQEAVQLLRNMKFAKKRFDDAMTHQDVLTAYRGYLAASGLSLAKFKTLNVVHVAGTKGKGSTCAFVESILRHVGLRTGFYSSPHLVSVRERIRINGEPINEEKFAEYTFQVHQNLVKQNEMDVDFLNSFRLLTCLAFYVFHKEEVDVVICEVGMGGVRDPTNIVTPVVTGITALGLDHQQILGETLEEIALAKAGIMKQGVPCFTLSTHPLQILKVLQDHAAGVECPLLFVPPLETYAGKVDLGIDHVPITSLNASLAIQLSTAFLQIKFSGVLTPVLKAAPLGSPFELQPWHRKGLANCSWPGRFQVVHRSPTLAYYLDGAHTLESLDGALAWFNQSSPRNDSTTSILVISFTGERDVEKLLRPFAISNNFHRTLVCPIILVSSSGQVKVTYEMDTNEKSNIATDEWTLPREVEGLKNMAIEICSTWKRICHTSFQLHPTVNSVVDYLDEISKETNVNVLVTGSLLVVGAFLNLIKPTSVLK